MIAQDTVLVQLVSLVERIPTPPPPPRYRGRPHLYSDGLFLKALVIMIVRRVHRVGELLAVLEEPTAEMRSLRELLTEHGRFPSRRTFERRLRSLPETLSTGLWNGLRMEYPLPTTKPYQNPRGMSLTAARS